MSMTQREQLERATARAAKAGLKPSGQGTRKADGVTVFAVRSVSRKNTFHLVAVEKGGHLSCDCYFSAARGGICVHRACVHLYLLSGLRAAEKVAQERRNKSARATD